MIFRGTDTTAILTEWVLAELVLNPDVQAKVRHELRNLVAQGSDIADARIANLPYLQAVIKETLRLHPPGPLLSWARLSTQDVCVAGFQVPKGTTAMVNMHAITHDSKVWDRPLEFLPQRFIASEGGVDFDVKGSDLRLAPFGAGRRVCPGRALGMATVQLWVAKLVYEFEWISTESHPVDLSEILKLSSEMVNPLTVRPRRIAT
jgi:cytochrome P450